MADPRARWTAPRSVSGHSEKAGSSTTKAASKDAYMPTASTNLKRKAVSIDEKSRTADHQKTKKPKTAAVTTNANEKRLRRYRSKPPQSFDEVYQRAITQRFYVIERRRCGTADIPEEEVELTGSTGNVYTVRIGQTPSCTCPHSLKGNQCKHWLYVMSRVLHAKFEDTYQLALVPSELRQIFSNAPPIEASSDKSQDKNRKPVEGDCPICFCELETKSNETIVWCRAACGQNIHKQCFQTWAATKRRGYSTGEVTCPFCRSVWQGDDDMVKNIKKGGRITQEGYVNVADQLGISTQRDYSTYSRWWRSGYY
ncbi:E3 ubiquitin-protein ligase Zswim2 [Colletotrichum spaethianum]|uniref:E3 ubiquitin-protein ligase Zswim2 n=1 Tax=Colletotrichum spaethianum TaxID=700344 RepID=A0AA37LKD3_9PEZI|nr:E3 ubiquitin-protein ligase Zswim2 [Colletotrichum spaethianum]GKT45882.1 E3 ubiquitin-protein ligase Zswim2 [Colletotrichum spaethianum]